MKELFAKQLVGLKEQEHSVNTGNHWNSARLQRRSNQKNAASERYMERQRYIEGECCGMSFCICIVFID